MNIEKGFWITSGHIDWMQRKLHRTGDELESYLFQMSELIGLKSRGHSEENNIWFSYKKMVDLAIAMAGKNLDKAEKILKDLGK